MQNTFINIKGSIFKTAGVLLLSFFSYQHACAQIPANAVNADPSAKAISQSPLGSNINGNAVLKFRFTNEATSVNSTGQIPANSVRLTISFPGKFAYTSVNSIPKFSVEDADNQAFGVVHLVNNALILEGEVVDLFLNVRGTELGSGTVTFNADRTTPVIVANLQTANDNSSSTFTTTALGTLPISISAFDAAASSCDAAIKWTVASETNTAYTEVQQSSNGVDFTTVYTLSTGANTVGSHSVKVSQVSAIAYYRLRIVDKDGAVSYSETRTVKTTCNDKVQKLAVLPSVFTTNTAVVFTTTEAKGPAIVTVQDMFGRVLIQANVNIAQGINRVPLNTTMLPSDTYFIRVAGKDWKSDIVKVIKQ